MLCDTRKQCFRYVESRSLKNFASLGLMQIANYIIPIIIILYVSRLLGVDFFGKASSAQNMMVYLTVLINYGFESSATQAIALNRDNKNVLSNFYAKKHFGLKKLKERNKTYGRNMLSSGLPIFLNLLFCTIYAILGLTFVGIYRPDYEVGIYSGAFKLIMAVIAVVSVLLTLTLFPSVSRNFNEWIEKGWLYFKKCLLFGGLGSTFISISVYLFSPTVVPLFLRSRFAASIEVVTRKAILPFLVTLASMITIRGIYGLRLQKKAPIIGFSACMIGLVCNYMLVPAYGAEGAVWAWCILCLAGIMIGSFFLFYGRKTLITL
ncbi:MAG: oligosaccharide flippase family protein [Bacteroidaceae bacterium]